MNLNLLLSKARRGELEPKELQAIVSALPSMDAKTKSEIKAVLRRFQSSYERAFSEKFLGSQIENYEQVLKPIQDLIVKDVGNAAKDVIKAINEAKKLGLPTSEVADGIVATLKTTQRFTNTNVVTAGNAINRAGTVTDALKNGIKLFKYSGPSFHARPFCLAHLGKILTIDEWRALDNGQGLPVEYYCGGHGCKHRLIPYID